MAGGVRRGIENGGDLCARQSLGEGHLVFHGGGMAQNVENFAQAGMGGEQELAGMERPVTPRGPGGGAEDQAVANDPAPL